MTAACCPIRMGSRVRSGDLSAVVQRSGPRLGCALSASATSKGARPEGVPNLGPSFLSGERGHGCRAGIVARVTTSQPKASLTVATRTARMKADQHTPCLSAFRRAECSSARRRPPSVGIAISSTAASSRAASRSQDEATELLAARLLDLKGRRKRGDVVGRNLTSTRPSPSTRTST